MSQTNRASTARSPLDHDPDELRRRRVAAGLTLVDLGARVGISYSYLSELERGTRNPSPPTLLALAQALDCTTKDLMPSAVAAVAEAA